MVLYQVVDDRGRALPPAGAVQRHDEVWRDRPWRPRVRYWLFKGLHLGALVWLVYDAVSGGPTFWNVSLAIYCAGYAVWGFFFVEPAIPHSRASVAWLAAQCCRAWKPSGD